MNFAGFVDAGGVALWTERRGHGSPVLVLTGTTADLRRSPTPFDGPLATAFDLASFDQRGLGRSDKPAGPYTIADYAGDAEKVLDALGWDRAHIIGISFGGMVAQELALRRPARIKRLVLCCSTPGGAGGSSYPLHGLAHLTPQARARRMVGVTDLRHDKAWVAAHPAEHERLIRASAADPFGNEPGIEAGRRAQLAARAGHDCWDRLSGLAAETLICGGRYDGVAPLAVQESMARRISCAALRIYEGGHLFLNQDPRALADIVTFLNGSQKPAIADEQMSMAATRGLEC